MVRRLATFIMRYYESQPGRRSAAKLLSKDEARRGSCAILRARGPKVGDDNAQCIFGCCNRLGISWRDGSTSFSGRQGGDDIPSPEAGWPLPARSPASGNTGGSIAKQQKDPSLNNRDLKYDTKATKGR
jgi:hypothetical protein